MKKPFPKASLFPPIEDDIQEAPLTGQSWLENFIQLGMAGHFPLFYPLWLTDFYTQDKQQTKKTSAKDNKLILKIKNKLAEHNSLERKKIFLCSLKSSERRLFIDYFLNLVEAEILTSGTEIH